MNKQLYIYSPLINKLINQVSRFQKSQLEDWSGKLFLVLKMEQNNLYEILC